MTDVLAKEVKRLQQDLRELRQKSADLQMTIEENERRIEAIDTESAEKDEVIGQLHSDIAVRDRDIVQLRGRIQQLEGELEESEDEVRRLGQKKQMQPNEKGVVEKKTFFQKHRNPIIVVGVISVLLLCCFLAAVVLALIVGEVSIPGTYSRGDSWMRSSDDMVMVYGPAGEFKMGSTGDEVEAALDLCNQYYDGCQRLFCEDERPGHTVALDRYWIDGTE